MRKARIIGELSVFIILVLILKLICLNSNPPISDVNSNSPQFSAAKSINTEPIPSPYEIMLRRDLLALMMAYPENIKGVEKGNDGLIYIVMQSGEKTVYDDMKSKSYEEKLANADIQDMMEQVYPLNDISTIMEDNFDPGRIRNYALLNEVYGDTKIKVEKNLTSVSLGSKNCSFNKNNNAASSLKAAFLELSNLVNSNPGIYSFIYPVNGTYNYRVIAGTSQLSPHSFGIAIDLKSNSCDYWRWATKEQGQKRLSSYPKELVRAFENNYFIWGGKWAHFDILHFEYRPELIIKSKYYVDLSKITDSWYYGYPDTELTKNYISIIDCALG